MNGQENMEGKLLRKKKPDFKVRNVGYVLAEPILSIPLLLC